MHGFARRKNIAGAEQRKQMAWRRRHKPACHIRQWSGAAEQWYDRPVPDSEDSAGQSRKSCPLHAKQKRQHPGEMAMSTLRGVATALGRHAYPGLGGGAAAHRASGLAISDAQRGLVRGARAVATATELLKNSKVITNVLNQAPCEITTLKNGLRVASVWMPGNSSTVGVWIDSGSRFETPETNGAAHFLEHMIFKGTSNRSRLQLEEEIEQKGAHLNAYTAREQTGLIEPSQIEAEKHVILREMEEVEKSTEEVIFDRLHMTAFRGSPLGFTILGPVENIQNMKREFLVDYIQKNYTADRMVFCFVGDAEHDKIVQLAEKHFCTIPVGTGVRQLEKPQFVGSELLNRNDNMGPYAHLAVAFEGVSWTNPDSICFMLMQSIIGSYKKSQEGIVPGKVSGNKTVHAIANRMTVGCAEAFSAFNTCYKDTGLFGFYAQCDEVAVDHCVGELMFGVTALSYSVTDEEVERAKRQLMMQFLAMNDSTSTVAEEVARQLIVYGRRMPVAEFLLRLEQIDAEEVKRVAWKYLHDQEVAHVVEAVVVHDGAEAPALGVLAREPVQQQHHALAEAPGVPGEHAHGLVGGDVAVDEVGEGGRRGALAHQAAQLLHRAAVEEAGDELAKVDDGLEDLHELQEVARTQAGQDVGELRAQLAERGVGRRVVASGDAGDEAAEEVLHAASALQHVGEVGHFVATHVDPAHAPGELEGAVAAATVPGVLAPADGEHLEGALQQKLQAEAGDVGVAGELLVLEDEGEGKGELGHVNVEAVVCVALKVVERGGRGVGGEVGHGEVVADAAQVAAEVVLAGQLAHQPGAGVDGSDQGGEALHSHENGPERAFGAELAEEAGDVDVALQMRASLHLRVVHAAAADLEAELGQGRRHELGHLARGEAVVVLDAPDEKEAVAVVDLSEEYPLQQHLEVGDHALAQELVVELTPHRVAAAAVEVEHAVDREARRSIQREAKQAHAGVRLLDPDVEAAKAEGVVGAARDEHVDQVVVLVNLVHDPLVEGLRYQALGGPRVDDGVVEVAEGAGALGQLAHGPGDLEASGEGEAAVDPALDEAAFDALEDEEDVGNEVCLCDLGELEAVRHDPGGEGGGGARIGLRVWIRFGGVQKKLQAGRQPLEALHPGVNHGLEAAERDTNVVDAEMLQLPRDAIRVDLQHLQVGALAQQPHRGLLQVALQLAVQAHDVAGRARGACAALALAPRRRESRGEVQAVEIVEQDVVLADLGEAVGEAQHLAGQDSAAVAGLRLGTASPVRGHRAQTSVQTNYARRGPAKFLAEMCGATHCRRRRVTARGECAYSLPPVMKAKFKASER
ncbi:mitochondrial processing peptidase [Babesia caballi]|uniref:Mitochondrial processing peptidase n=1 Tax=Babesia caballi TaxID=5871 RepID=A0AAV4M4P3_BABCB|nr:mitochondrial processing peptidase [Babesia caballi]